MASFADLNRLCAIDAQSHEATLSSLALTFPPRPPTMSEVGRTSPVGNSVCVVVVVHLSYHEGRHRHKPSSKAAERVVIVSSRCHDNVQP